ncbi:hypothetical protein F5882DRAFT_393178 [Hyaloscypha sp. PMI_1271]|nr:hypothetical protein F5882DRAFT_393178 [Hyaloscypha sp. PMI_1271]
MMIGFTPQVLRGSLGLLLFSMLLATTVSAGSCSGSFCGTVYNQSPWTLKYTTDPVDLNGGTCTSCCYFWNWNNGSPRGEQTRCTQKSLAKTKSAGGSGVDVDGFCYADRDYYFSGKKIIKGQWTKIATTQSVRCVSSGGVPHCCLTSDPQSDGCCWGSAPTSNGISC